MNVQDFFDTYTEAFDAFDHEAIADHYHFPSLLASADDCSAFYDRAEAERKFKSVCDHHKRIGYHRANALDLSVAELTDNLCRVTITWRFESESGQSLMEFLCTYTLADYGEGPKIIAALVHG